VRSGEIPLLTEFNPNNVTWQYRALKEIRTEYDYDLGVHQVLCSGAVGSAKTLFGAHLGITHCLGNKGAVCGIGRVTMPDLKETLLHMILEHLGEPGELVDYEYNRTKSQIEFSNGSRILTFSWHDKKWKKFRSYAFTMFIIEELTENDGPEIHEAIMLRLGRNKNIKEKLFVMLTNPDDPEHWAFKKIITKDGVVEPHKIGIDDLGNFIMKDGVSTHVYYSLTEDNKFLDPAYIDFLERNLDPVMAERMLKGRWVPISKKNIYYSYGPANQIREKTYQVDKKLPIRVTWDFNIGDGKPMSATAFQYTGHATHWFKEYVVYSARTGDILQEMAEDGLFEHPVAYVIHGDANGSYRDTRSLLIQRQWISIRQGRPC